ncbi:MAG: hypothetical protein WCB63_17265 [Polyangiales bacterium]
MTISGRYPSAQVRWSLVVYRDRDDACVVQYDESSVCQLEQATA